MTEPETMHIPKEHIGPLMKQRFDIYKTMDIYRVIDSKNIGEIHNVLSENKSINLNDTSHGGKTLLMHLLLKFANDVKRKRKVFTDDIYILINEIVNSKHIDLGVKDNTGKTAFDYALKLGYDLDELPNLFNPTLTGGKKENYKN